MYDLTVIIPTFKEEANIRNIITEVDAVFKQNNLNGEILVVDDNSPDGTILIVNEITKENDECKYYRSSGRSWTFTIGG